MRYLEHWCHYLHSLVRLPTFLRRLRHANFRIGTSREIRLSLPRVGRYQRRRQGLCYQAASERARAKVCFHFFSMETNLTPRTFSVSQADRCSSASTPMVAKSARYGGFIYEARKYFPPQSANWNVYQLFGNEEAEEGRTRVYSVKLDPRRSWYVGNYFHINGQGR